MVMEEAPWTTENRTVVENCRGSAQKEKRIRIRKATLRSLNFPSQSSQPRSSIETKILKRLEEAWYRALDRRYSQSRNTPHTKTSARISV